MKTISTFLVLLAAAALPCFGSETHADRIVARVLENVAKIKAEQPEAVPMAFWDFDGTIIRGDISEGFEFVGGKLNKLYKGLIERTIEAGLCTVYPA